VNNLDGVAVKVEDSGTIITSLWISNTWFTVDLAACFQCFDEERVNCAM
jgi:hypothetical protein